MSAANALDVPAELMGNYHLQGTGSPAPNAGAASKGGVSAPAADIDGDGRPALGGVDIGADELPGAAAALTPVLDDFNRANGILTFKGGWMNGAPLTADEILAISRLPSRDVLYGRLVGMVASPLTGYLLSMRGTPTVTRGDFLFQVGTRIERDALLAEAAA